MTRKAFFSFHYQRDVWRVNVVRNSAVVESISAAGFRDASLWEEAIRAGDDEIEHLIRAGLEGTTVTVVLIGSETASLRYVSYAIEQSVTRGNGVFGVRINEIKDRDGRTDPPGNVPDALIRIDAPVYKYEYGKLGQWVELAYAAAHPNK